MIENLENEIWKDCKGYEGFYQVSNLGRIKSLERIRTNHTGGIWIQPERILKGKLTGDKYVVVHLKTPKGKDKIERVHRLVAIAFIDNPERKTEVNHINSIRNDNRVENLEWVTREENIAHSVKSHNKSKKKILCITTGEIFYTSNEAAQKNGGDAGNIRRAAREYDNGKIRKVCGYSYCYIDNDNYYLNLKNNNLGGLQNGRD